MQVLSLDARGGGWKASVLWAGRYGRAVFQTAPALAGPIPPMDVPDSNLDVVYVERQQRQCLVDIPKAAGHPAYALPPQSILVRISAPYKQKNELCNTSLNYFFALCQTPDPDPYSLFIPSHSPYLILKLRPRESKKMQFFDIVNII